MATPTPIDLRDSTDDENAATPPVLDLKAAAEFVVEWQIEEPEASTP